MEFLNNELLQQLFSLFTQASVAGAALCCTVSALTWGISSILKLVHKFF